ncbi:MAG: hypothetical protein FWE80_00270 [Oscillospiraceae bacterium]|nr:hypothetical protein [Oscillospiraceae bacterium]
MTSKEMDISMGRMYFNQGFDLYTRKEYASAIELMEKSLSFFHKQPAGEVIIDLLGSTDILCKCFLLGASDTSYVSRLSGVIEPSSFIHKFSWYWNKLLYLIMGFDENARRSPCEKINAWMKENGFEEFNVFDGIEFVEKCVSKKIDFVEEFKKDKNMELQRILGLLEQTNQERLKLQAPLTKSNNDLPSCSKGYSDPTFYTCSLCFITDCNKRMAPLMPPP